MLLILFFLRRTVLAPRKYSQADTHLVRVFFVNYCFSGGGSLNTAVRSKYAVIPLTSVNKYSEVHVLLKTLYSIYSISLSQTSIPTHKHGSCICLPSVVFKIKAPKLYCNFTQRCKKQEPMGDLSKKRQYIYLFMPECSLPNELTEVCQRQPTDKMWPYSSIQIVYLFLSHY